MDGIKLENISKSYDGNNLAVKNINLEINDKEFVVLVGPSGCGKSTILRMIAGLEEITDGNIYIDGVLVNDIEPKDRDIAMVFQNYALYPSMTVYDNIAFSLKIAKFTKEEIEKKVNETAKKLQLEDLLDRKPRQLSGGQRQRVALGRALVRNPKAFLLDEPLSNLDAKLRTELRGEIINLHNDLETTFIYVTHDQVEAMTMADRIVVLDKGQVQQVDTPRNIYLYPNNKFVAEFIGNPNMNFLNGVIRKNNDYILDIDGFKINIKENHNPILEDYIDKEILIGVRPEDILIIDDGITVKFIRQEMLGSQSFMYLKNFNNKEIIGEIDETTIIQDEYINIGFDKEKIHLFDKDTESRINISNS